MGPPHAKIRCGFWSPILAVLLAIAPSPTTPAAEDRLGREHEREVDLLLVLAVDVSESINRREAWLQRFGHAEALADPLVLAAINSGRHGRIAIAY